MKLNRMGPILCDSASTDPKIVGTRCWSSDEDVVTQKDVYERYVGAVGAASITTLCENKGCLNPVHMVLSSKKRTRKKKTLS